ncbi:MAG: rRNA maturation RNase YbeY [Candidatus Pelagibacter sp.]|nr:rRNA maturation RNase YbeY [Candidatus Pelagibacter sp.]|tara:strand:- start:247 stop:729 length:483 start_codon:yes stop_codon:yes gene_type:complete
MKTKALMIKINVILNNIIWKKYLKDPHNFIDKRIRLLNKKNKLYKKNILICSLLLSGAKEIKKLNKKFRKKNKSTDVLSFPFYTKNQLNNKIRKEKEVYLGDIIINLGKVKNKSNKSKFKDELNKLWIHGLLHLLGYEHKSDTKYLQMQKLENKFSYLIK